MSIDVKVASVAAILNELGVPLKVASKPDRIAIQKAIYLAQRSGADLGYRFSWYINGPYSAKLADAYYQADEEKALYEGFTADEEFSEKLSQAKNLIEERPPTSSLPDWLEAVGSLDFMVKVVSRKVDMAMERCKEEKPHLRALFDPAKEALLKNHFFEAS